MIGFDIDLRQFSEGCKAMEKRGGDLRPVWKAIRPFVRADVADHFVKQEGPAGGWKGYAPSTIQRIRDSKGTVRKRGKRKGHLTRKGERRVGNMLGSLKSAWVFRTRGDEFVMTSRVWWSDSHMQGNGKLPARPFAWVSAATVDVATGLIESYVVEAW